MKADKAEQAERDGPPAAQPTDELLSTLDAMLATAVREADQAVQAARRNAATMVAAERDWATVHLRALGLDPVAVLGTSGWTLGGIPDVAPPASVGALWQRIEVEARSTSPALVAVPSGSASRLPATDDPELQFDDAELFEVFWGDAASGRPGRDGVAAATARPPMGRPAEPNAPRSAPPPGDDPEPTSAAPTRWLHPAGTSGEPLDPIDRHDGGFAVPRLAAEPETFDVFWNGSELFDGFWSDAEGEESRRPLRERLRRRATQGQP